MVKKYPGGPRTIRAFEVYKITCHANGKGYVGITVQGYETRYSQHIRRAVLNTGSPECNSHLSMAIRKHGEDEFSVEHVASAVSLENLLALETLLISQEQTLWPNGYNRTEGGEGCLGHSHPVSEAQKAAIRAKLTGRKLSAKHKANIAEGVKEWAGSDVNKARVSAFFTGTKQTPEHIEAKACKMTKPGRLRGTTPRPRGRWVAQHNGKYVGIFSSEIEAHEAWKRYVHSIK